MPRLFQDPATQLATGVLGLAGGSASGHSRVARRAELISACAGRRLAACWGRASSGPACYPRCWPPMPGGHTSDRQAPKPARRHEASGDGMDVVIFLGKRASLLA